MQDKELYQQILGLSSPWKVTDVEPDQASSEIRVKGDYTMLGNAQGSGIALRALDDGRPTAVC